MTIEILEIILRIVALVLAGILIPYLRTKLTDEQEAKIRRAIEIAVKAAEQLFPDEGSGILKKDWVLDYILSRFSIERDDAERLLEAFVYELNRDGLLVGALQEEQE